jgi:hypothetical protein
MQSESSDGVRSRLEERKKRETSNSSNEKDDKSLTMNMIDSSFRVMESPKGVFLENVEGVQRLHRSPQQGKNMIMSHKNRHHANSLEASKFPSRKTTA